jgi:hypothetical protein
MNKNDWSKIGFITLLIVLPTLTLCALYALLLNSYSLSTESSNANSFISIERWRIFLIGRNENRLFNSTIGFFNSLGVSQMKRLEIQEMASEELPSFDDLSLVIFDGEWLSEHYEDSEVYVFLQKASRGRFNIKIPRGFG